MGFFHTKIVGKKVKKKNVLSDEFFHEHACGACSLNTQKGMGVSKADFTGDTTPTIYIVVDSPKHVDLIYDKSLHLLMEGLRTWFGRLQNAPIRFGFILRCDSTGTGNIKPSDVECCRGFLKEDIEKTKPVMIASLGDFPLKWFIPEASNLQELWRGRIMPVTVGGHQAHYMPMIHPDYVKSKSKGFGDNEWELAFKLDIKKMKDFLMAENTPEKPTVIMKGYFDNIELIDGLKPKKDLERVKKALSKLVDKEFIGLDIENYPLKPWGCKDSKLLSIAFGDEDYAVSYPLEREDAWDGKYDEILSITKEFILKSGVKITHTLKHELIWLREYFGDVVLWGTDWGDVKTQAYVLDSRTSKRKGQGMFSLAKLTTLHLGFDLKSLSNVDVTDLRKVDMHNLLKYNVGDVRYLPRLFKLQKARMVGGLEDVYKNQIETTKSLTVAESRGVQVDIPLIDTLEKEWKNELGKVEEAIFARDEVIEYEKTYNKILNPGSDTQLAVIFEKILKLDCKKRTAGKKGKEGKYSLDKFVLAEFVEEGVEIASLILKYREFTDLIATYCEGVRKRIDYRGVLHTDYNSEFTDTGRLSSSNPNLQNWDSRKNKHVRRLILAEV